MVSEDEEVPQVANEGQRSGQVPETSEGPVIIVEEVGGGHTSTLLQP